MVVQEAWNAQRGAVRWGSRSGLVNICKRWTLRFVSLGLEEPYTGDLQKSEAL